MLSLKFAIVAITTSNSNNIILRTLYFVSTTNIKFMCLQFFSHPILTLSTAQTLRWELRAYKSDRNLNIFNLRCFIPMIHVMYTCALFNVNIVIA